VLILSHQTCEVIRRDIHAPRPSKIGWHNHAQGDKNGSVITLTEPQVWTLIGVFAAAIFGIQGIAISSFRREMQSIRSEIISVRNELITRMDSRFDHLDRDVAYLMRKEFGEN
jgi:hypothetical protein